MAYYNSKDFDTMQQEAIRRVQEMQQRSRSIVNNEQESKDENSTPPPQQSDPGTQKRSHPNSSLQGLLGNILGGSNSSKELFNIGNIKIDEEKALIAMMIYILYKNGSDIKLLLGLGYLLI